ncbi:putative methyltransferase [Candidatus Zinderia insecticola CARI]|uniref:Putative methyltransferase n=1 Tax=Zinderia insecticola (strain CARI) TaxID=871271 RepID=E0TIL8_ZINIC|nr:putative methyltransferase [Candidatus Zinderia insecticola CARI]
MRITTNKLIKNIFDFINILLLKKNWNCLFFLDLFFGYGNFIKKIYKKKLSYILIIEKSNFKINIFKNKKYDIKIIKNNSFFFLKKKIKKNYFKKFNIIFIDPPFYNKFIFKLIYYLNIICFKNTIIILEIEKKIFYNNIYIFFRNWKIIKINKIGIVYLFLLFKFN